MSHNRYPFSLTPSQVERVSMFGKSIEFKVDCVTFGLPQVVLGNKIKSKIVNILTITKINTLLLIIAD